MSKHSKGVSSSLQLESLNYAFHDCASPPGLFIGFFQNFRFLQKQADSINTILQLESLVQKKDFLVIIGRHLGLVLAESSSIIPGCRLGTCPCPAPDCATAVRCS